MPRFVGTSKCRFLGSKQVSEYYKQHEGEWNWQEYNKAIRPDIETIAQSGAELKEECNEGIFKTVIRRVKKVEVGDQKYLLVSDIVCYPIIEVWLASWWVDLMILGIVVLAMIAYCMFLKKLSQIGIFISIIVVILTAVNIYYVVDAWGILVVL